MQTTPTTIDIRNNFFTAVKNGNVELVETIFKLEGPESLRAFIRDLVFIEDSSSRMGAIHIAAENNDVDMMKCLIAHGAQPLLENDKHQIAKQLTTCGKLKLLLLIHQHEYVMAMLDKDPRYKLALQALKPDVEFLDQIDAVKPFNLDEKDIEYLSHFYIHQDPFLEAVLYGDLEKIKEFVAQGRNLNIIIPFNRTPLIFLPVMTKQVHIIKYFIEQGVLMDQHQLSGHNLLYLAILESDDVDLIELLIKGGAKVNASSQQSPLLHAAVALRRNDTLSFLIHAGAKTMQKNAAGETAFDMAVKYENVFALIKLMPLVSDELVKSYLNKPGLAVCDKLPLIAIRHNSIELLQSIHKKLPLDFNLVEAVLFARKLEKYHIYCFLLGLADNKKYTFSESIDPKTKERKIHILEVIGADADQQKDAAPKKKKKKKKNKSKLISVAPDVTQPTTNAKPEIAEKNETVIQVAETKLLADVDIIKETKKEVTEESEVEAETESKKVLTKHTKEDKRARATARRQQLMNVQSFKNESSHYTWGQISNIEVNNETYRLTLIDGTDNQYLLIPKKYLYKVYPKDADDIDDLAAVPRYSFCGPKGEQGLPLIKNIGAFTYINIQFGDQKHLGLKISRKIKRMGRVANLFCVSIPSDQQINQTHANLWIALKFDPKGYHENNIPNLAGDVIITKDDLSLDADEDKDEVKESTIKIPSTLFTKRSEDKMPEITTTVSRVMK